MEQDLILRKKQLRKEIINGRLELSLEEVEAKSKAIADYVLGFEVYREAKNIMIYIDMRNEVKTEAIIEDALAKGKRIFTPVTDLENRRLYPTEIKNFPEDLEAGTFGVMEPKGGYVASPNEIDLVIVPGVGFDEKGNRLGYGGGFYDRFLPQTKPGTKFIAIAYELQIKNNVYHEEHDQPVHFVVTEERVIKN